MCFLNVIDQNHKRSNMMPAPNIALIEYISKIGMDNDADFLREGMRILSQMLIELEAEQQVGAKKYERSSQRKTHRNGYRQRAWETRVGEIPLSIPKLRGGTFFPSLLEPRKRSEKALLAVVQSAYVHGASTRKVDHLVQALGLTGIEKSKVSRICKELDEAVEKFRNRSLDSEYPYLWLDAVYLKVR
jgi:putative transposase